MKFIKNLYDDICTFENLYLAYKNARKNKRFREEVLDFSSNVEEYLMDIRKELVEQTYKVGKYREFFVYEPKKRLIMALPFRDRVVQWAIYQKLNPYYTKGYVTDSFACIEGRGAHQAIQRLHYWLKQVGRKPDKYFYLKLDISKYYYRVDHDALVDILSRKIKDIKLMNVLEDIIRCKTHSFGLPIEATLEDIDVRLDNKGMPIGNLTSQMFANIYLNELDQYIKRKLRIHYYIRYMDDVIILHESKEELHKIKNQIEEFLMEKLKLNLNNKTAIRPVTLGIEFVGYKVWNTHIKLRKSTSLKMKRRLKYLKKQYEQGEIEFEDIRATMASYFGLMKHSNSYNLKSKLLDSLIFVRKSETGECE